MPLERPTTTCRARLACAALTLLAGSAARAQDPPLDPCVRCDLVYSGDGSGRLYEIDTAARTSRLIGTTPTFFDVATTLDGRLFGVTAGGTVQQVSACDAALGPPLGTVGSAANGLAGDLTDPLLFAQGPPLAAVDLSAGFSSRTVGGSAGPDPPFWCGSSSGDLALDPDTGVLYSALGCGECPGDMLVTIDAMTGQVVEEIGCLLDEAGTPLFGAFGLAFGSCGDLWIGTSGSSSLWLVDPLTAVGQTVPIAGGYSGTYGLASLPCVAVGGACDPCTLAAAAGWAPRPPAVGPVLLATGHGPPGAAVVTADFDWSGDLGAPRPDGEHFHVWRGRRPELLSPLGQDHPLRATAWTDATPRSRTVPACVYLRVVAADSCETEELRRRP